MLRTALLLCCWLPADSFAETKDRPQAVSGVEGRRAWGDLTRYYQTRTFPPFREALEALEEGTPAERKKAGLYLIALFEQGFADERNQESPTPWQRTFTFDPPRILAGQFRLLLAEICSRQVASDEAIPVMHWLIAHERDPRSRKAGFEGLWRINSPKTDEARRTKNLGSTRESRSPGN